MQHVQCLALQYYWRPGKNLLRVGAATTFNLISNFYVISRGWEADTAKVSDLLKFRAYFSFEGRIDCFARKLGPVKPRFPGGAESGGKKEGGWGGGLWLWLMAMIKSPADQRLPGAAGGEFPGAGRGFGKGRWEVAALAAGS